MFALRLVPRRISLQTLVKPLQASRNFHPEFTNNPPKTKTKEHEESPAGLQTKYEIFKDEDSQEIFDVEEEKRRYQEQPQQEVVDSRFTGLNLDRESVLLSLHNKFLKNSSF